MLYKPLDISLHRSKCTLRGMASFLRSYKIMNCIIRRRECVQNCAVCTWPWFMLTLCGVLARGKLLYTCAYFTHICPIYCVCTGSDKIFINCRRLTLLRLLASTTIWTPSLGGKFCHTSDTHAFFVPKMGTIPYCYSFLNSVRALHSFLLSSLCVLGSRPLLTSSLKPNSWTYNLLRYLGIILTVLRLEVSVYNVYITNQFQTTFV